MKTEQELHKKKTIEDGKNKSRCFTFEEENKH